MNRRQFFRHAGTAALASASALMAATPAQAHIHTRQYLRDGVHVCWCGYHFTSHTPDAPESPVHRSLGKP